MRRILLAAVAIATGVAAFGNGAQAYQVTMSTANTSGSFNAADDGSFNSVTVGSAISAVFTYTGPLSFNVNPPQNTTSSGDLNRTFFSNGTISGYNGSGALPSPANADFSSRSSFLRSSASNAGYGYGSLLTFDLGVLSAGTVLTINHDDGISLYQNGLRIGSTVAGPTSEIAENVSIANTGDTILYYSRENGAPSVLNVAVPEPASMALLGAGLAGLGFVRRRKTA